MIIAAQGSPPQLLAPVVKLKLLMPCIYRTVFQLNWETANDLLRPALASFPMTQGITYPHKRNYAPSIGSLEAWPSSVWYVAQKEQGHFIRMIQC